MTTVLWIGNGEHEKPTEKLSVLHLTFKNNMKRTLNNQSAFGITEIRKKGSYIYKNIYKTV